MKKVYIVFLILFTVAASGALFYFSYGISAKNMAIPALNQEIKEFEDSTLEAREQNKEMQQQIDDMDTELSTKDTVNNYYMEYKKTHDDLSLEVSELKKLLAELDSELAAKQGAAGSQSVAEAKKGRTYNLTENTSYTCPDKIPEGRYTAKGSGTFTITSSEGKTRVSQNLDTAYEHSYTFNLSQKESIKVTGEVTLTEIK